ncbi:hypothetical protein V6N12_027312 [Hibiscus sabdariffa]|uniref:NAD-dependent epimerase/dehydratase domain-containing protein n=1 Tax=Hibiscus sabdariffa TaxID=183260 RepID=A0ABR2DUC4_9ROSI
MSETGKVVCVTGASGYIASWLVNFLLQRGYTVKATVRDPSDPKKSEHLLALDGAKERLHLFKAELLDEGAFDSVVDGCVGVFHTASPLYLNIKDPQAEMVDPALKGTLNVLRSCAKVPSIKRVVLTSSIGAVVFNGRPLGPDIVVDETWFSDPNYCEKSKKGTLESFVCQCFFCLSALPTVNTSVDQILKLINGPETYPNTTYRLIDVRDVANAHVLAFENSSAHGRYPLIERVMHCSEVVQVLRKLYPALRLPEKCGDEKLVMPVFQASKDKAKVLGINFTPLEASIKDTVESLKEKKLFSG